MNELKIIDQRDVLGKDFKIYGDFDNPLFLAKDVAAWIDYDLSSVNKMLAAVDVSEKVRKIVPTLGGGQESWFLTEDGLYEVLMLSRKPTAKQFKSKVKAILKEIRKHGTYTVPQTFSEALRLAADLAEKNAVLQAENDQQKHLIGELQPKADYVDYILSSPSAMTITQIAADYGMSANKLNKILQSARIQRSVGEQWILYAEHMNKGYTKSETIEITRSDGRPDTKLFTKWTQKGRLLINEILNKQGIYANMDLLQVDVFDNKY